MSHPVALPARVARWLHLEQHVNELIHNDVLFSPIAGEHNGVVGPYRPENAGTWRQDVIFDDERRGRAYGPVRRVVLEALGLRTPAGKVPLFVHPQSRELFAGAIARSGLRATDVSVRATASCRSLVAASEGRPPWVLKVGIDTLIGNRWRGFEEHQVARALVLAGLMRGIDPEVAEGLRFDWFDEVCGVATDVTGAHVSVRTAGKEVRENAPVRDTSGWLLRRLPACLLAGRTTLVPLFSLVSSVGGAPSMLVRMIRAERSDPTRFVVERLLRPLVGAYAHLAFREGLLGEMHAQNVLYEVGTDGALTGRIVLRDITDTTLNLPLRIARGRPLPRPREDLLPSGRRIELAWITTESFMKEWMGRSHRAYVCVCGHGLQGSVWVIHRGLRKAFPSVRFVALKSAFLWMWRRATVEALHVDPVIQRGLAGIPVDEAIHTYLAGVPWASLGARPCRLPPRAKLRWMGDGPRRDLGARGASLETAWGELFLVDGAPAYFRPAF